MRKILLWLDDIRDPNTNDWLVFSPIQHTNVAWVKTYQQFVDFINFNGLPDGICFDHDLADNPELREMLVFEDWYKMDNNREYTGLDCAKWLIDYCMDNFEQLPKWVVHSANPAGCDNINGLLKNFKEKGSYQSTYWSEEPNEDGLSKEG